MDKYDLKVLLEQAYKEGLTKQGLSNATLDGIRNALETDKDKPNISSVFGCGCLEDMEGELCIFVSDKRTWENEGCCADSYFDDTFSILYEIGFAEECDGIFSQSAEYLEKYRAMTRDEIVPKLLAIGFEYNELFEKFMLDSE